MDIKELRKIVDEIDSDLMNAFMRRMDVSARIAKYKAENGLPVFDPERERQKLYNLTAGADERMRNYVSALYSLLFDISRSYQERKVLQNTDLTDRITMAIEKTPQCFPSQSVVACQGIEGAYSQFACDKIFDRASIMYCNSFDSVFSAIENGLCEYGVLPLENSTAGSINRIYDLMMKYDFSIVRSARLRIDHCLLAKEGTGIEQINEIYSHEQAISQCAGFLKSLNIKVTACDNTAEAARMVAQSPRDDVAALSAKVCADIYSLACLAESVQDKGNNCTKFICISKDMQIYPGADKTSIMMSISHKPGSLYNILSRFYVLGINLIKLESRPIPDKDFEFMFYFDLETSVYSDEFKQVMNDLSNSCEAFKYLGSYSEIV